MTEPEPEALPQTSHTARGDILPPDRSYAALFAVPGLRRVIAGMLVARVAGGMVGVALILFTLAEFGDPGLAGLVTAVSILPGLALSPIAGALLDRHGRVRLIVLDLLIAGGALALVAIFAIADVLTPPILVGVAAIASTTGPLSATGLRSLFPILVPHGLWERANAIDSNGYVLATLVGPPAAGVIVQVGGGPAALFVIGLVFAAAALIFVPVREPVIPTATSGRLLRDALDGLAYTLRNRTLLGLGLSITTQNLGWGMMMLLVPLLVLERLGGSEITVGLVFAALGAAGAVSALAFGRLRTHGRERLLLAVPMVLMGLAVAPLLVVATIPMIALSFAIAGFLNGPLDIALFTLRQRRTDPAWTGRAFAVSMSFNYVGYPVGTFVAGRLGVAGIEVGVAAAVVCSILAALLAWVVVPAIAPEFSGAGVGAGGAARGDAGA